MGEQVHRRGGAAHARQVADRQPWMAQPIMGGPGHQPDRPEKVAVVPGRRRKAYVLVNAGGCRAWQCPKSRNGWPLRSIIRRKHPISKNLLFQSNICIDKRLGKRQRVTLQVTRRAARRSLMVSWQGSKRPLLTAVLGRLPILYPERPVQRGGATTPSRTSWTTTPESRGGGASQRGWARLVATSLSPACHRRATASGEKSAIFAARSAMSPS